MKGVEERQTEHKQIIWNKQTEHPSWYLRLLINFQETYFLDNSFSSKDVVLIPSLCSVSMSALLYAKGNHRYQPDSWHTESEPKHTCTYQNNIGVPDKNYTQSSRESHAQL